MNRRKIVPFLVLLAAAGCADATAPSSSRLAPLVEPSMNLGTQLVPGEFIVVLRDGADVSAGVGRAQSRGGEVVAQWATALRGYAVRGNPSLILSLRSDPDVEFVEQVQEFTTQITQTNATWGLDRIDQRTGRSGTYNYTNTGTGVTAYIIDTGIRLSHTEFQGRAVWGASFAGGPSGDDCNGHGTHVAGTVGGRTYGVAKNVALVAVRVLGCGGSGTTTGVVSGIDWVKANAKQPAVANMSLGGGGSTAIDAAVNGAINSGITFAVAAGNSNANACNYSPARVAAAITVGATTSTDARASYSNWGTCLDIFAPGSSITSAWTKSNTATRTISGTSMASPHVAGVAALYLQSNPQASPATVRNAIVNNATTGVVGNPGTGSPNKLLYSLFF